jgi:hypothetical protein
VGGHLIPQLDLQRASSFFAIVKCCYSAAPVGLRPPFDFSSRPCGCSDRTCSEHRQSRYPAAATFQPIAGMFAAERPSLLGIAPQSWRPIAHGPAAAGALEPAAQRNLATPRCHIRSWLRRKTPVSLLRDRKRETKTNRTAQRSAGKAANPSNTTRRAPQNFRIGNVFLLSRGRRSPLFYDSPFPYNPAPNTNVPSTPQHPHPSRTTT